MTDSNMTLILLLIATLAGVCLGDYTDPHCNGKQVIVQLFEWKWSDVALECEGFLSKKGYCGVQVSPANEHIMVTNPMRPWWERYQPVSYRLHSRSGNEVQFSNMVQRCNAVGVRIYVDVILNNMASLGRSGVGTDGSYYNSDTYSYPAVPYTQTSFNPYCELSFHNDTNMTRNCYLDGFTDLNQKNDTVRNILAAFLNKLIDIGVAGFQLVAAKNMWPADITAIQNKVKDLPEGGRPFFYHEVIEENHDPINATEYTPLGYVTEFRYCQKLKWGIDNFGQLKDVVGLGMIDSKHALVFVDNHDTQRSQGVGSALLTHKTPKEYKMAVAFLLANDYGFTRVMSSYYFSDLDIGPPHNADYSTKDVTVNSNGTCGNGWVCEHRWRAISNMVVFRNAVAGTSKENWQQKGDIVAFARGNKGFFAMAKNGHMNLTLHTGLPAGDYCNLVTDCATKITVDVDGNANIVINDNDEPIVAFIAGGLSPTSSTSSVTTPVTTTSTRSTNTSPTSTRFTSTSSTSTKSTGTSSSSTTSTSTLSTSTTSTSTSSTSTTSTSTSSTSTTSTSTTPTTTTDKYTRTIIILEKRTNDGEDVFIEGGLDHNSHPGCTTHEAVTSPCAIPIRHRNLGSGSHYDKVNAWSEHDSYLDWYGAEPLQGRYQGEIAQGTPAVWTTNKVGAHGYSDLNMYGDHYWLVDIDMDCSRTDNGWFDFKGIVNGQWENDIHQGTCTGAGASGAPPQNSRNHRAKCGMMNVYHFGTGGCEIKPIP